MTAPSKKEIQKETEAMHKIYECYRYLLANTGSDEVLREKIDAIAREHLLSKMKEMQYSVEIPLQNRKRELEELLKKLKEERT